MPCFRAPAGARRRPTPGDAAARRRGGAAARRRGQSAAECRGPSGGQVGGVDVEVAPLRLDLAAADPQKLRRLVAHAVGVGDPSWTAAAARSRSPSTPEGRRSGHAPRPPPPRISGTRWSACRRTQSAASSRASRGMMFAMSSPLCAHAQPLSAAIVARVSRKAPSSAKGPGAAQVVRRFRRVRGHRPSVLRARSSAYRSSRPYQPSAPCLAGGLRRVK